MNKQQELQALQTQLESIQQKIEKLKEPETYYVVVHSKVAGNWYNAGEIYKVYSELTPDNGGSYHRLFSGGSIGLDPRHVTKLTDVNDIEALDRWTTIMFKC